MSIQPEGDKAPFDYRGFQMVNDEKLREIFGRQSAQGKVPVAAA